MGNSFKLIKYIGIGAVVMIVIAFAMFAMKGFDTFIAEDSEALEVIDSHEVYVKVSPYEGRIMGSKVRRLIDAIYKLYTTYPTDPTMLPDIAYQIHGGDEFKIIESTVEEPNEKTLKELAMKFDSTHSYDIEFVYSKKGYISGIVIKYDDTAIPDKFVPNEE